MLMTFSVLLLFQCLGEGLAYAFGLPVPGPVIGMLLLLAALAASPRLLGAMEATANELLRHLSLLFVPAGVGIMVSASVLRGHWLAVGVSVIASTALTLGVTALVMRAVSGTGGDQRDA
jgi:holin-like protein